MKSNLQSGDNLDKREYEIYERMLEHTAYIIINAYIKLPEFNAEGIKRLNFKMNEIADKIDDLIEQTEKIEKIVNDKSKMVRNFERSYRNTITIRNNYINLFGAGGFGREYKRYPLSIAYVELEYVDEVYNREIPLENIFEKTKNIWISGEADSGKQHFYSGLLLNQPKTVITDDWFQ